MTHTLQTKASCPQNTSSTASSWGGGRQYLLQHPRWSLAKAVGAEARSCILGGEGAFGGPAARSVAALF